jgi:N-acetyl-1-D-myo-inositol-2-amino-2-deoxy-alpha-D-glucopyranoside deacetylase
MLICQLANAFGISLHIEQFGPQFVTKRPGVQHLIVVPTASWRGLSIAVTAVTWRADQKSIYYAIAGKFGSMPSPETPRLLFVHAHPDDETLTTGGTIARYVAGGADVHVVTCTLGEEGEVIGDLYSQLAVDNADQLGGYRISELTAALNALGVKKPNFLGGPGHWRDSGMAGTEPRGHRRFMDADMGEAVVALVAIIRELRPHVVITYDPNGGYGHPDHIQAHRVTTAAVKASETDDYPGTPWRVPKFYWTVVSKAAMAAGLDNLDGAPADWMRVTIDALPYDFHDDQIGAVIDTRDHLSAKVAALRAHATQVAVAPDGGSFALTNNVALPLLTDEHYVLVAGTPGERDHRGWEIDLLAGLNVG